LARENFFWERGVFKLNPGVGLQGGFGGGLNFPFRLGWDFPRKIGLGGWPGIKGGPKIPSFVPGQKSGGKIFWQGANEGVISSHAPKKEGGGISQILSKRGSLGGEKGVPKGAEKGGEMGPHKKGGETQRGGKFWAFGKRFRGEKICRGYIAGL